MSARLTANWTTAVSSTRTNSVSSSHTLRKSPKRDWRIPAAFLALSNAFGSLMSATALNSAPPPTARSTSSSALPRAVKVRKARVRRNTRRRRERLPCRSTPSTYSSAQISPI